MEREQGMGLGEMARFQQDLLDGIPAHILLLDSHGTIIATNRHWDRLAAQFGLDDDICRVGGSYIARCDANFSAEFVAAKLNGVRSVLKGERAEFALEYSRQVDGRPRWYRMVVEALSGSGRSGAVVMHQDISESRHIGESLRLHEALQVKERYQRALIDNFPFMVWLKDTESRLLAVNQPYADAAGIGSPDELVGKTDLDFWPRDLAERYRADDRAVMSSRRKVLVEEPIETAGRRAWHETYKAPVEDERGVLLGTVGFARDITDRKRLEQMVVSKQAELHAREQEFRLLAENSPDVIVRYDTAGRRSYANPTFFRLARREDETEAPRARYLDKTVVDAPITNAAAAEAIQAAVHRVLATERPGAIEVTWALADGTDTWHSIRFVPEYDGTRNVTSVLGIGRDITELKLKEQRLNDLSGILRELLAHRETAREEERKYVAREIHDELGQLLSVLRWQVVSGTKTDAVRSADSAARMLELVDGIILTVRNIGSMLRPKVLDSGVIAALEWLVEEFSKPSGIECSLNVRAAQVEMDEAQATTVLRIAQQALTNVVQHARAGKVDIDLARLDHAYVLRVTDDGIGFDTRGRKDRRSFGLLGMEERAKMIGGELSVTSAPGYGTAVELLVPMATKDDAA